jgi:hypothetical protein
MIKIEDFEDDEDQNLEYSIMPKNIFPTARVSPRVNNLMAKTSKSVLTGGAANNNSRSNSRPRPNTQVLNDSVELEYMSKLEETPPPAFLFKTTK